ncbi:uncharacterized protein J3R85_000677 [Psidium guajava]|nr:uncharacterized protein J3R85_000677 [Psidium guajava]
MPSSFPPTSSPRSTSTTSSRVSSRARPASSDASMTIELLREVLEVLEKVYAAKTKAKMKSKVGAGQTKHNAVKTDLETKAKAKMRGKVGAGMSEHNAVKTHLENQAKMKAAKTDLQTKNNATGPRKVEMKETTARAAKIFKNQAAKNEAWPKRDPKRPSKGQKKTVRFNLPEDDFGRRCKRQTAELHKNKRGQEAKGEQRTMKHRGSSRMPLLTRSGDTC